MLDVYYYFDIIFKSALCSLGENLFFFIIE